MTINRIHHAPFVAFPNSTARDSRLSFKARGVLAMVLSHADYWDTTKAWIETQGTEGPAALTSAFKELEQYGYRKVVKTQDKLGHWVTVVHWSALPDLANAQVTPTPENPGIGSPRVGLPTVGDSGGIQKNKPEEEVPTPPTPPRGGAEDGPLFTAFWNVYPYKIGKGAARRAWAKAQKKVPAQKIIDAAREQRDQLQDAKERGFCPHPSTWLNGERWADEDAEVRNIREAIGRDSVWR